MSNVGWLVIIFNTNIQVLLRTTKCPDSLAVSLCTQNVPISAEKKESHISVNIAHIINSYRQHAIIWGGGLINRLQINSGSFSPHPTSKGTSSIETLIQLQFCRPMVEHNWFRYEEQTHGNSSSLLQIRWRAHSIWGKMMTVIQNTVGTQEICIKLCSAMEIKMIYMIQTYKTIDPIPIINKKHLKCQWFSTVNISEQSTKICTF
jgi:hypothetical protein